MVLHAIGVCPICTYRSGRASRYLPASLYKLHDAVVAYSAARLGNGGGSGGNGGSRGVAARKLLEALTAIEVAGLDIDEAHEALFAMLLELVQLLEGGVRNEWKGTLEGRVKGVSAVLGAKEGWYLEETVQRARAQGRQAVEGVVGWGIGALREALGEITGGGGGDEDEWKVELSSWAEDLELDGDLEVLDRKGERSS